MKRLLLFAAALVSGCASHARYIERSEDYGVVAVPDNEYRREAMFLIVKHLGPDYKILSEGNVVCGSKCVNGAYTTGTELRIEYTRASRPAPPKPPTGVVPVQWPAPSREGPSEGVAP
jgi:hypothetical protein